MSNPIIGQKYEDRTTGKIGTVESRDEKYKTLSMVAEDGSTFSITEASFRSKWRKYKGDDEDATTNTDAKPESDGDAKTSDQTDADNCTPIDGEAGKKAKAKKAKEQKEAKPKFDPSQVFGDTVTEVQTIVGGCPVALAITTDKAYGIHIKDATNKDAQFEVWVKTRNKEFDLCVSEELDKHIERSEATNIPFLMSHKPRRLCRVYKYNLSEMNVVIPEVLNGIVKLLDEAAKATLAEEQLKREKEEEKAAKKAEKEAKKAEKEAKKAEKAKAKDKTENQENDEAGESEEN